MCAVTPLRHMLVWQQVREDHPSPALQLQVLQGCAQSPDGEVAGFQGLPQRGASVLSRSNWRTWQVSRRGFSSENGAIQDASAAFTTPTAKAPSAGTERKG